MEPLKSIGQLLTGNEKRDAIHIAIMPAVAGQDHLCAGDQVSLVYGTKNTVRRNEYEGAIGVVDPFLPAHTFLQPGDKVWVFLFPGSITGLRHEWVHPELDAPPTNDEHELWLRKFADKWNFDYAEMISAASAETRAEWGNWVVARGKDLHSRHELGEDHDLFWEHLEALLNTKYSEEHRKNFGWSCSC